MISVRDGKRKRERERAERNLGSHSKYSTFGELKRKGKNLRLRYAYTLTLHENLRGVLRAEVSARVKLRYACWPGHSSLAIQSTRKPKMEMPITVQHEFRIQNRELHESSELNGIAVGIYPSSFVISKLIEIQ